MRKPHRPLAAAAALLSAVASARAADPTEWRFALGAMASTPGTVAVAVEDTYDTARGFGFEPGQTIRKLGLPPRVAVTAYGPFLFSVKVPEGNYRVTVDLGDPTDEGATAVKAEGRRVMLGVVQTRFEQVRPMEFTVNVHTPRIDDDTAVPMPAHATPAALRDWDDKLTLEFAGPHPAVANIAVRRDDEAVTVFLAGDSTVTDQPDEPWAGWGQALPQFFSPRVAVANYAEPGETLASFRAEHRWAKLLAGVRPGDYVLVQFGHNDMKETGPGVGPFTSFADALREYVADVRAKGGLPVLVTPPHRRMFDGATVRPTFGDYPAATRRVAEQLHVPLIDLQAMSKPLYESMGPEGSKLLFVYFSPGTFPGQSKPLADDTRFRAFGADQIARCVVRSIRDLKLPLASEVRPEVAPFDPAHPDDPAAFDLPPSAATPLSVPVRKR